MDICSLDTNLAEHVKGDFVVERAELGDFGVRPWLLSTKVVCWEGCDTQAFGFVLCIQSLKLFVLWRQTALARNVHYEDNIALVGAQLLLLAINALHRKVVHTLRCWSASLCAGHNAEQAKCQKRVQDVLHTHHLIAGVFLAYPISAANNAPATCKPQRGMSTDIKRPSSLLTITVSLSSNATASHCPESRITT